MLDDDHSVLFFATLSRTVYAKETLFYVLSFRYTAVSHTIMF